MKNLKLKIIISVYVCLIILALYNAFHSYYNNISQEKQTVFAKLSTLSKVSASQINGDIHEEIINTYKNQDDIKSSNQNVNYLLIHQLLNNNIKATNTTSPIYTLFPSNDHKKFYFGVTSSETPYFRHRYHTPPEELINDYEKGGYIDEYKDENGIWLSSFSPVKNSAGKVVAVVQADQNFKEFILNVNRKLVGNISFIALIYTVIGFLLYIFLKDVLIKEESYSDSQKKYNDELEQEVNKRTLELNALNKKLLSVNKELESFFYSTSHDIRGPLCRILGLSSLAKSEDDKQELVELIELESQKMDNMLKKMILVNNLRTKTLKIEHVKVCDKINQVLSSVKKKYHENKAELIIKTETQTLKAFNSDDEVLESIICNLLDNAFKFSDVKNPKIEINSFIDKNGILSLSVVNNGSVFSDEEVKNAFELFKNASTYESNDDGIRLGLYTIKIASDKLNGLVQIGKNKEDMTEITVLIPDYYVTDEIANLLPIMKEPIG